MRTVCIFLALSFSTILFAQPLLQVGDPFPNLLLRPVVNAPAPQVDVWSMKGKYIILNQWGTWCAPCIPEMDSLKGLQQRYGNRIQVIGVSNDSKEKLLAYLKKRPTPLWLASDTASTLYRQVGFSYVGQSIILDPEKRVVALVKTDSITTRFIERLLKGEPIVSNAETRWSDVKESGDPFGVDSSMGTSVSLRSFLQGKSSMSLTYIGTPLEGRRVTYFNVCPTNLYRDAYSIGSPSQIVYEVDKNKLCNFDNKATLLCFDFMVMASQKDSFKVLMQRALNGLLPYKARIEQRKLDVFVLKRDSSGLSPTTSAQIKLVYSYSGNGFSGTAIPIGVFAQYLSNEAGRPVVDETGLSDTYDIETKLTLRTKEEILNSLKPLGLQMQKEGRLMPVLVIYE